MILIRLLLSGMPGMPQNSGHYRTVREQTTKIRLSPALTGVPQ